MIDKSIFTLKPDINYLNTTITFFGKDNDSEIIIRSSMIKIFVLPSEAIIRVRVQIVPYLVFNSGSRARIF